MKLRVCLAGATGWVGRCLAPAIAGSSDLELVGAVSRTHAGKILGEVITHPEIRVQINGSVKDALAVDTDVLVDFTRPQVVMSHVLEAFSKHVAVVIGTSGLTDEDYKKIDTAAKEKCVGALAAGNFAITAVLMQCLAVQAAKLIPHWEIIDYAHDDKVDAPSGTTRELSYRLGKVSTPQLAVPIEKIQGLREARGARLNHTQIHSIRLPGYVISAEVIFGNPDEKLIIRHEAGSGASPYVAGAMLAIRAVRSFSGLKRGLDTVMNL